MFICLIRRRSNKYLKIFSNSHAIKLRIQANSLNRAVILLTFMFIIMTLPSACASFFFDVWFQSVIGKFVISLCDTISFSYHALNVIVFSITNRKYKVKLKHLLIQILNSISAFRCFFR